MDCARTRRDKQRQEWLDDVGGMPHSRWVDERLVLSQNHSVFAPVQLLKKFGLSPHYEDQLVAGRVRLPV